MIPSGAMIDGLHTYDYFGMIPKNKLTFNPPMPKLVMGEMKGASGVLDYTETATGKVAYQNRKGTFSFLVFNGSGYMSRYNTIRIFFQGQSRRCILDDDPAHEYNGRFYLSGWKAHEDMSEAEISYIVTPHRYSTIHNISNCDWQWDDMDFTSDDALLYGAFTVKGTKARTLVNPTSTALVPTFICTSQMDVLIDGITYHLPAGTTSYPGFVLYPGDTYAVFSGNGTVRMAYPVEVDE